MELVTPFWFKQRQCKAEPVDGNQTLKVTGPNLGEAYLQIEQVSDTWVAHLRGNPAGPDIASAESPGPGATLAWEVAFELYRRHVIA